MGSLVALSTWPHVGTNKVSFMFCCMFFCWLKKLRFDQHMGATSASEWKIPTA